MSLSRYFGADRVLIDNTNRTYGLHDLDNVAVRDLY